MTPRNSKFILLGSLLAGTAFLVGILGASQLPKLRSWILVQIEEQSRDHLPVKVLPRQVDIDFLPLGTTVHDVKIMPKDELKAILDPLEIKRVSVTVSLWQLLQGKLRLSSVEVEGTHVTVRIPKSEKHGGKPLDGLFDTLNKIPVSRVKLTDVSINATIPDPKLAVAADSIELEMEKIRGGFTAALEHATLQTHDPETGADVLLDVEAAISANPQRFLVDAVKIRRGDSFFMANGHGSGDTEALDFKEFDGQIRTEIALDSMRNWATKTFNVKGLPPLKGRLFVDGRLKLPKGRQPSGDFRAHAEGFTIDKIGLGHLETEGTYKNDTIKLPKLTMKNPAGGAEVDNVAIGIQKNPLNISLEGALKAPSLDIHKLLQEFGVGNIPVSIAVTGDLPCKGTIRPKFNLDCKANVTAKDILVEDGVDAKKSTIVRIPVMNGVGIVNVNDDEVSYRGDLSMPGSKGHSDGVINFDNGFKINFDADHLAFKDIANLANLKLEGAGHVKGTTTGNGHTGQVTLALNAEDMWFEDFWLGNVKGQISYAQDMLKFADLNGNTAVSRYNGDVGLDLHKKLITVNARFPFFDTRDILKIFSRKVQLSFPVLGTGQASIKANGPLDLGHLSYDLRTSVFRGSVAGESFDQAHFDVKSNGGEVRAERVQLNKGQAKIDLTGVAHPDGKIETMIHGRGLRLEDTNTVARSGFAISGALDFDMAMNGPVLAPDTDMKGTLTRTSIGDQSVPDSNFRMKFTKNSVEGGGQFLGDVVDTDFTIPFNGESPFHLKLATKDWNFAPLFAAIAGPSSRKDYEGHLTTQMEFAAPNGGFWNSTGQAAIEKLSLARGALKLENPKPMFVTMKAGEMRMKDVALSGENIFLNAQQDPNPTSKMDLMVNGKVDLGLLALMTPFFEDLRGLLSFKLQVKGGESKPTQLLGSAYIEKGYIKFFDFPHAFEDIRADLLFNQQKVLFNSIRAEFGGGRMTANGGMELRGYKDTPLNVTGSFEKITLNIPDRITTSGSGDFSFSGNGFPFLLKGTYNVSDGLVTKSFTGGDAIANGVDRRDAYLPDFLVQENFIPLNLDMTVDLSKGVAIKNDLVDGRALGSLTLRGNPSKPAIGGTLTADKDTKVIFRDTNFDVTAANIQFNGTTEVDPKLYVSARTRIDPYDVTLLVQGTGNKPELLLSSTPQLAERDIVSLLAFGSTDSNLDKGIKSGQQESNIGGIGASGIVKHNPISDAIKERLGFDVQFQSGFDDTNTSVQKIVATRQIGQNLTFSTGYSYGLSQSAEAHIRYRLNDRLSLVGAYVENNYTEVNVQQQVIESQPNVFGLDMEYKFEFK